MSKINKVILLSEYKIDEKDKKMNKTFKEIDELIKKKEYYFAVYQLDNLILQDGTNEKYNYKLLCMILAHYDDIIKRIASLTSEISLKEENEQELKKYKRAIKDASKYNFNYFRDCFDKYEVSLNQKQLDIIYNEKKKYNNEIMKDYPELNKIYTKLIKEIESGENKLSADDIYYRIKSINEKIPEEKEKKLFYLYKYLDISLINESKIFEYLSKDKFYLNKFSFGLFNNLGIPIGYSKNSTLEYRYLFLLIKNKINEIEENNNKKKESPKSDDDNNIIEKDKNKLKGNKKEEEEKKLFEIADIKKDNKGKKDEKKGNKKGKKETKELNKSENENQIEKEGNKIEKPIEEDTSIEFVFSTFYQIFLNIKTKRLEYIKYFVFLFLYIFFKGTNNISEIYKNNSLLLFSYFQILCGQFSIKEKLNKTLRSLHESATKTKIEIKDNQSTLVFKEGKKITLNCEDYSINSFIINNNNRNKENNEIILLNNSKKLFCKDKIFGDYFDDFINLLKKICKSNLAKNMQSLHEDFKEYETFYSNKKIMDDLFNNRLKFYPFECEQIYGITDKCLMEIYLSSIYIDNIKYFDDSFNSNYEDILYIFNMSFSSVTFQHESLNHYIRGYLFYSNSDYQRKISIDTKKAHYYYPKQLLEKIKEENQPEYLNKYLKPLSKDELNKLKKVSNFNYKDLIEEFGNDNRDIKMDNNNKSLDDEGYYYERQLFAQPNEKRLSSINFLQALMILDEDAYNLNPVHFHYCFLQLGNNEKYSFYKENFTSELLIKLLKNINLNDKQREKIKKMTVNGLRGVDGENKVLFERNEEVSDVMSSYAKKNNN